MADEDSTQSVRDYRTKIHGFLGRFHIAALLTDVLGLSVEHAKRCADQITSEGVQRIRDDDQRSQTGELGMWSWLEALAQSHGKRILLSRGHGGLRSITLAGHRLMAKRNDFLCAVVRELSYDAVQTCIRQGVTERDLRDALHEVLAIWRRTKNMDSLLEELADTDLTRDEWLTYLLAGVFLCADRAWVHGTRGNKKNRAADFFISGRDFLHFAWHVGSEDEFRKLVLKEHLHHVGTTRHKHTNALKAKVIAHWQQHINPELSAEKAAEMLGQHFPLEHRTIARYVAEAKRRAYLARNQT